MTDGTLRREAATAGPTLVSRLTPDSLQQVAAATAPLVAELLGDHPDEGYLNPEGAARYLGVRRKRVYDLKSMGVLVPDGYDGRTPLFARSTLDAYVRSARVHE
jgi:hypothetical protein